MDLEDKIYSLDEAKSLIESAIDSIEETAECEDIVHDLRGMAEGLKRKISELEAVLNKIQKKEMEEWKKTFIKEC